MRKLMTKIQISIILFFGLTIFSCKQTSTKQDNCVVQDSITMLLNNALTCDTLEFNNQFSLDNYKNFLFFKSGYIINKSNKNALAVFCPTDTTYTVRLYAIDNNNWGIVDSVNSIDAYPSQFYVTFDDYNFDNQLDIYINVSASNGWSLSRGHLLIIEPLTQKIHQHKEARDLANMRLDKKTNIVFSETWNGFNLKNQHELTVYKNKWIGGKLKTVAQKDSTYK